MSRRAGILIGLVLAVVAAAGIAWIFRLEILLEVVEIQQRRDVGSTRDIEWDSGTDPAGRSDTERPPNIVVILADDLGWNDLSWLGGGVAGGTVPTPNIDSLAREGVHFANGYAANGTCAPSRAALMTGRYGTRFGFEFTPTPSSFSTMVPLLGNTRWGVLRTTLVEDAGPSIPYGDMGVPASEITLAELLEPAGYHSVHIGKWHLGRSGGMAPHDQGFDESLLMASGLYLPEDHPDVVNSKQDFDGIDRFLWRAMHFSASFNGRSRVRAGRLPDRLLHRPGRPRHRGEPGQALLPLPRALGRAHAAAGAEGRLRCPVAHRRASPAGLCRDGPLPRPQHRPGA